MKKIIGKMKTSGHSTSFLLMIVILSYRLLGFFREILVAHYFGANAETDAFYFAYAVPNTIVKIFVVGVAVTVIVPELSRIKKNGSFKEIEKFKIVAVSLGFKLALIATTTILFTAKFWLPCIAYGFNQAQVNRVSELLWILMPLIIMYTGYTSLKAIQNCENDFLIPELGGLLANVITLVSMIIFSDKGIIALAYGFLVGGICQCLLLILRSKIHPKDLLSSIERTQMKRMIHISLPIVLAELFYNGIELLIRVFSTDMPTGSLTAFEYAYRISYMPVMIITGAVVTVAFPRISELAQGTDQGCLKVYVTTQKRFIEFLLFPIAILLFFESDLIVTFLFGHGSFTAQNIQMTSQMLKFLSPSIWGISLYLLYSKGMYALRLRKSVTLWIVFAFAGQLSLYQMFLKYWLLKGLAFSFSMSFIFLGWAIKWHFEKVVISNQKKWLDTGFYMRIVVCIGLYYYVRKGLWYNSTGVNIFVNLLFNSMILLITYSIVNYREIASYLREYNVLKTGS